MFMYECTVDPYSNSSMQSAYVFSVCQISQLHFVQQLPLTKKGMILVPKNAAVVPSDDCVSCEETKQQTNESCLGSIQYAWRVYIWSYHIGVHVPTNGSWSFSDQWLVTRTNADEVRVETKEDDEELHTPGIRTH